VILAKLDKAAAEFVLMVHRDTAIDMQGAMCNMILGVWLVRLSLVVVHRDLQFRKLHLQVMV
jgi:hypothetical protein